MNWYKVFAYVPAISFFLVTLFYFLTDFKTCIIPFEDILIIRLIEIVWMLYAIAYFTKDILVNELK